MTFSPRIHEFTLGNATLVERLFEKFGAVGRKAELLRAERVYMPVLLCLSQRYDNFLRMNTMVREAIAEARKASSLLSRPGHDETENNNFSTLFCGRLADTTKLAQILGSRYEQSKAIARY
jgi:hypothetical protein